MADEQENSAADEAAVTETTPRAEPPGEAGAAGATGDRRGPRGRGRYVPKRRVCQFCADKVEDINYKDTARLRRFISERGKIEPRRKSSTCARHQRKLAEAMKRARHLALLPYTNEHVRVTGFFPPRG
jgi:small subunit ribosomal protein S18